MLTKKLSRIGSIGKFLKDRDRIDDDPQKLRIVTALVNFGEDYEYAKKNLETFNF
jgi:hypothetical protein